MVLGTCMHTSKHLRRRGGSLSPFAEQYRRCAVHCVLKAPRRAQADSKAKRKVESEAKEERKKANERKRLARLANPPAPKATYRGLDRCEDCSLQGATKGLPAERKTRCVPPPGRRVAHVA